VVYCHPVKSCYTLWINKNGLYKNGGVWNNGESLKCWLLAENIRLENVKKYKNLHIMDNLMEWNAWLLAENIRLEIYRWPKADMVVG
jgi:hypothetical protein